MNELNPLNSSIRQRMAQTFLEKILVMLCHNGII